MRIAITGAQGFLGKNFAAGVRERQHEVLEIHRGTPAGDLDRILTQADALIHLAGVNRPLTEAEFGTGNADFTDYLCQVLTCADRRIPVLYSSSIQAEVDNAYGRSKQQAERHLAALSETNGNPVIIYRLPNVFGKWSRPEYNSVVATFCYNVARGLPVRLENEHRPLNLVYVDDVVEQCLAQLLAPQLAGFQLRSVATEYQTSTGELLSKIRKIAHDRLNLQTDEVGSGLMRALHATYLSFLEPQDFAYTVPVHSDRRGAFVEFLKTPGAGQFSYFTAGPGVTRGGHYHHTKVEKFLVAQGRALFRFSNICDQAYFELEVEAGSGQIIESIPGWTHDVKNIGQNDLVVMLWANEIFDRARPDTYAAEIIHANS